LIQIKPQWRRKGRRSGNIQHALFIKAYLKKGSGSEEKYNGAEKEFSKERRCGRYASGTTAI
jgi:hypothetical protein